MDIQQEFRHTYRSLNIKYLNKGIERIVLLDFIHRLVSQKIEE
jgi:hypothetical protein